MPYQPRWYIEEAIDSLFDFFREVGGTDPLTQLPVKANPLVALPTGTGKSFVIAEFVRRAFAMFPQTRLIMGTHVKELIEQNAARMVDVWPQAPIGIHSAGLKAREHLQPIIFGGIKSMVKNPAIFGHRDLLVVDEAHLVSPSADTSYLTFIMELMKINPYLKVIGLSATIYRMRLGLLTNGNLFSHIAYDLTDIEGFNRLIAEGYLCPVVPKKPNTMLDTSGVGISTTGDFNEAALQAAVDKQETTFAALTELVQHGWDRRSWVVFAAGIEHAEHIGLMLNTAFGVPTGVVHSKMKAVERDETIAAFKRGELRCIVNKDILTTGFDHPPVDLIGMLRPTMSTGLWVQMLGRGTRPYFGKANCLVMDFAGNTRRLGPINDPVIPRPKSEGPPGDAPVKICDSCGVYNHASARNCIACNTEFGIYTLQPKIERTAGTDELLRSDLPQVEYFDVERVVYTPHTSRRSGLETIKVAYYCSPMRTFYEYITFEHAKSFAIHKAHDWLRQRTPRADFIIAEAENNPNHKNEYVMLYNHEFRIPRRIRVWINKPNNPEVLSHEF